MGGTAFAAKGVQVARMDSSAYSHICTYLGATADSERIIISIPKPIKEKKSHGDVDVLVSCRGTGIIEVTESWRKVLRPEHEYRNGPVVSLAVKLPYSGLWPNELIQLDLIQTRPEWHEFATNYFSYNDAGNLYGRIAHRLGFKLGFDGLTYVLRDDSHIIDELVVTRDWDTALRLLALDPTRQEAGFETYEQLFQTVAACPWFSRQIFLLENRNHVSRVRDAKRATYNMFLQWLEERHVDDMSGFPWTTQNKEQIRQRLLDDVRYKFPDFNRGYEHALWKVARKRQVSSLVNGDLVSKLSGGKTGPELGALMTAIRQMFPDKESYETFVLAVGEPAPGLLLNRLEALQQPIMNSERR
jgi:hypothetical protein